MNVVMNLQAAGEKDLEELNAVISDAIMQWDLPERVKRLSLPSFHYDVLDLQHMDIQIVRNSQQAIVGVIATETTDLLDTILLHGVFVSTKVQRKGVGKFLLKTVEQQLLSLKVKNLLVKPQKGALNFFHKMGFESIKSEGRIRYENLLSKML